MTPDKFIYKLIILIRLSLTAIMSPFPYFSSTYFLENNYLFTIHEVLPTIISLFFRANKVKRGEKRPSIVLQKLTMASYSVLMSQPEDWTSHQSTGLCNTTRHRTPKYLPTIFLHVYVRNFGIN